MLLDIVDNLPRLHLSSSQFKIILWLLKQCRVLEVPSYDSFRKLQSSLRTVCGSEPTPQTLSLGNKFSVNDVQKSIAKVFASFDLTIFVCLLSTGLCKSRSCQAYAILSGGDSWSNLRSMAS